MEADGRDQWDDDSSIISKLKVNFFQREVLSQIVPAVARRGALHCCPVSSRERQLSQRVPLPSRHIGLVHHELVARQIEVLQRSHGHKREGAGCPISTDNGITPKEVINAFWVVRCGTKWECAGQEAVELLVLPDNASPLRGYI